MVKININEIYDQLVIQGEGKRAGRLCTFIRTNGCNLRCQWLNPDGKTYTKCDTPYTSWEPEKANMMEVNEVITQVLDLIKSTGHKQSCQDIIITGGEPFLQKGTVELINKLHAIGFYVTVETNGTIFRESKADLISMSPKLITSTPHLKDSMERNIHMKNRIYEKSVKEFLNQSAREQTDIQFKFVYSGEEDIKEIQNFMKEHWITKSDIWIMPQGEDLNTQLAHTTECMDMAIKYGFNFTSRLHVLAYGNKRGV